MTLSASEKAAVLSLWEKIVPIANDLGAEALERLFLSFPQTKAYFNRFDLSHGSADLLIHGGKLLDALGQAASNLDNIESSLSSLNDVHAFNLRGDPGNFKLLSHSIQVTLASHFQDEFTASIQAAWDIFIDEVFTVLTSK
ncbi:hemoglobin subunit alpha-3-like [Pelodytes ibericus]